jgi:hypothetical protein
MQLSFSSAWLGQRGIFAIALCSLLGICPEANAEQEFNVSVGSFSSYQNAINAMAVANQTITSGFQVMPA